MVSYNALLAYEAGLIIGENTFEIGPADFEFSVQRLTYNGHEYLDTICDPDICKEAKEGAQKAKAFGLQLLAALARGAIKMKVEKLSVIEIDF